MLNVLDIQSALRELHYDAWLLYDFRGSNPLAQRVTGIDRRPTLSRRWWYLIPAQGEPQKLVHRVESGALDHLPGAPRIYLTWQELEQNLAHLLAGLRQVAMEYAPGISNPYISRVDGGTIEAVRGCGVEIVSSGDLIQIFEARWDDSQWASHQEATRHTTAAYDVAWKFIAEEIRKNGRTTECAVQDLIMRHFKACRMTTYHPPIVAVGPHSGDPHYETGETEIRSGDLVLIDLWAKLDQPRAVYSDLTRIGFVENDVPGKYTEVFKIVATARDAAIHRVETAFQNGEALKGWQVDDAARSVIAAAGYGQYFVHRTGHSIGEETHGNGANMDNLETREERLVLPGTCFSIEPGIYLSEFGIRSEINVFVDRNRRVHVTGGPVQREIVPILKDF